MDYEKLIHDVARALTGCDDAVAFIHRGEGYGTARISLTNHKWAGVLVRYGHYRAGGKLGFSLSSDALISQSNKYQHPRMGLSGPINIAATKTPMQIAKEITRRLLPGYVDFLRIMEQVVADTDARDNAQLQRRIELSQLVGEKTRPTSGDDRLHVYNGTGSPHVRGQVYLDGRVGLELDYMPFEMAKRILAIVTEKGAA